MTRFAALIAVIAASLMSLMAGRALADGCTNLGGAVDPVSGECHVSGSVNKSGIFNLDQTLRIMSGAKITVPVAAGGAGLTISICPAPTVCDFIMEAGAQIIGDASGTSAASGVGATIDISATGSVKLQGTGSDGALITSNQSAGSCTRDPQSKLSGRGGNISLRAGLDIDVQAGSLISANGTPCPAGAITLLAQGSVTTAGDIRSISTMSGTGAVQLPGGGPISVIASCQLLVTGTIVSQGFDAGADLVHLESGCAVTIDGLVQSLGGSGHAIPNSPGNHCFGPDPLHPSRPDKPNKSTACIEVWSGGDLTVTPTGEVGADTGDSGGNEGTSWVDLFARGSILIDGNDGAPFAVHANGLGGSGPTGENGGIVRVKSVAGGVTAHGKALQASALRNNTADDGGTITVEAALNVLLERFVPAALTPTLEATAPDKGGTILVRSFSGSLAWTNGLGQVDSSQTLPSGIITLQACLAPGSTTAGTTFKGVSRPPTIAVRMCSPTAPTLPGYVILPNCVCVSPGPFPCPEDRFRLITWTVNPNLPQAGQNSRTLQHAVTAASTGSVIGMFGHTTENVSIPNKALTITQCTDALITAANPGLPVLAISSTDPVMIIGLETEGGSVGWLLNGGPDVLRAIRAAGASQNGVQIKSSGNHVSWNEITGNGTGIFVEGSANDLRGGGVSGNHGDAVRFGPNAQANLLQGATVELNGGNGIAVEGASNTVRDNPRIDQNSGHGVLVTGSNNLLKTNTVGSNAGKGSGKDGFNVTGDGNTVDSNVSNFNVGGGFTFGVTADGNVIKGSTAQQNGGTGISVGGHGNTLQDNTRIDQNGGHGVLVTGSGNVLKGNVAGSSGGKGNGKDGFHIAAPGTMLDSNRSNANQGDGFNVSGGAVGSPNAFKNDQSNQSNSGSVTENKGAEYTLLNYVQSLGGNKADNTAIPQPTKCPQFPALNQTTNFATAYACGD